MVEINKILFISRTSILGGAESSLCDLLRGINKSLYYPIVIMPDKNGMLYLELKELYIEVKIIKMPFIRKTLNIFLLIWFFLNLIFFNFYYVVIIKKINPKIVVCNSFQDAFFIAFPTKLLRKKLIINIKNILDKDWKKKIRAKLCGIFADKIIASSKRNEEDFTKFNKKNYKAITIYDGLDFEDFTQNYSKINVYDDFLEENDSSLKIINIGNLSELKGQALLIESILTEKISKLDLKVFLFGDVYYKKDLSYKEKILNMIKDYNLENKVYLMGYRKNIKDYIKYSDMLVHCPVLEEGLGMVVLQGFCYGKIVIGTNIGGIPEMIINGENGFLCNVNKEDLAEKILYVYNNFKKLDKIRDNSINTVRERFSLSQKILQTENVFKELLNI